VNITLVKGGKMSKAQLRETSTSTLPEKRIWIVTIHDEAREIAFTFLKKSLARAFKASWDEAQPMITVLK